MSGQLRAIWVKRAKGGPMDPALTGVLVAGRGLAGNANQGGRRQVVLLEEERWTEALADLGSRMPTGLGAELPPSTRRANLMISDFPLAGSRGRILRIGPCRLRIWTECTPCHQMDEACPGLRAALRPAWRGGACAEILEGGAITLGDTVDWEPSEMAMIAAAELASLKETAHLLRSPKNAERLLAALAGARAGEGKTLTVDQLRRELGLDREG